MMNGNQRQGSSLNYHDLIELYKSLFGCAPFGFSVDQLCTDVVSEPNKQPCFWSLKISV